MGLFNFPVLTYVIGKCVEVRCIRTTLYRIQSILYSRSLLTSFILYLVYILFCFVPLLRGTYFVGFNGFPIKRDLVINAVMTKPYLRLLIVAVFLAVPPTLQLFVSESWKLFSKDKVNASYLRTEFLAFLFLIGTFVFPNLFIFRTFGLVIDPLQVTDEQIYIWICLIKIQQVGIALGMLGNLFGTQYKYISNVDNLSFLNFSVEKRTVNIMLFFTLASIFQCLNGRGNIRSPAANLGSFFFLMGILLMLTMIIRIWGMLWKQSFTKKGFQFRTHYHVSDFLFSFGFTFYIIICAIFIILTVVTKKLQPQNAKANLVRYMICYAASQVFLLCVINIIPGMKHQRLASMKHEQLETRLNLIRYVSHEMRTPLNTVSMGATIMKSELLSFMNEFMLMKDKAGTSGKGRTGGAGGVVYNISHAISDDETHTSPTAAAAAAGETSERNSNRITSGGAGTPTIAGGKKRKQVVGKDNSSKKLFQHSALSTTLDNEQQQQEKDRSIQLTSVQYPSNASLNQSFSAPFSGGIPSTVTSSFREMIETINQISDSCTVAVSTLDDLLTFDKIDEQKLVIEIEELNPWKLLKDTAKPFKINAHSKNVCLDIKIIGKDMNFLRYECIKGDSFKLAQVIRNLLSNAIKFTPIDGKVDVMLELCESVERGRTVRFSVKDNGAGISKQNIKKLFGQYVQFNASQLQGGKGSGLGLWITKSKSFSTCFLMFFLTLCTCFCCCCSLSLSLS
jgi:signal transduction histidine kinase